MVDRGAAAAVMTPPSSISFSLSSPPPSPFSFRLDLSLCLAMFLTAPLLTYRFISFSTTVSSLSHLRFHLCCHLPFYLCCHHARPTPTPPGHRSYLKEVIQPAYLTLAEQYEDRRAGSKPYMAKNYDDFNETFWQRGCLSLDVVGLTQDALRRKFNKTFVERQSWLVPLVRGKGREGGEALVLLYFLLSAVHVIHQSAQGTRCTSHDARIVQFFFSTLSPINCAGELLEGPDDALLGPPLPSGGVRLHDGRGLRGRRRQRQGLLVLARLHPGRYHH